LCDITKEEMEYQNYFSNAYDPFDGMIPQSASYVGHALPKQPNQGLSVPIVVSILIALILTAIGVFLYFYRKRSDRSDLNTSEGTTTSFSASIATITDPNRRAEAESLNRALTSATTETTRNALRTAIATILGGGGGGGGTRTVLNQHAASPQQQQESSIVAEPPVIYKAPNGDPNFIMVP
jgi:hypothetical protein